jgi:predicted membrane channel-forming protein YqfA (hemolysin III family)
MIKKNNMKAEARQLPLMLGKLVGGILAVIGFCGFVYITTRPPQPTTLSQMAYIAVDIIGVAVFVICNRTMSSCFPEHARDKVGRKDKP